MWFLPSLLPVVALSLSGATWANNTKGPGSKFVTTRDGRFHVNGSEFKWIGTSAYWLPSLNTEEDIVNTLSNISAAGIKVVRTWAFNDVETIPENGTWFQLVQNGTVTVNNGTNGLQKLDLVLKHAERFGIYITMSLTNNWNPRPLFDNLTSSIARRLWDRDVTPGTNNSLPRNFLSNDYGGMDVYVRQFGLKTHDEFYTNETLLAAFKNYTTQVVSRYVNSPAVFSWEVANDPRCNSSISASATCETRTVTQWHSDVAQHIRTVDPNHLISSGDQGFFCVDCPKLFQRTTPPPPEVSPGPGALRKRLPPPLTKERLMRERREQWKKTRAALGARNEVQQGTGVRVRGRWVSTPTRRQADVGVGSAFDGAHGVDSEDILSIPEIGFGSFQLFPDQNSYGPADPSLPAFNNTVQSGNDWIRRHVEAAAILQKPVSLTGFGLVTRANAPFFVPFNSSVAPFAGQTNNTVQPFGVTNAQRDDAYSQWLDTGISSGLDGIMQYQWGQGNLTAQPGTTISPDLTGTTSSPNTNTAGQSPNDGYSINGVGQEDVQNTLKTASQEIGSIFG
ncbi:glycoside hydrolase family 5 protein [Moniliophthora roreri MCA 2997]|uniref:mannan endo-1,4-beta-mannosidase n=1 Tax=Moniliophthora roreri (strain MCA 2997) TaxID=1381753 RepID=V2XT71_MONRO|nr:glycoside hydrolase family 5 protein [Moniliophthora roreri MCA 2997]